MGGVNLTKNALKRIIIGETKESANLQILVYHPSRNQVVLSDGCFYYIKIKFTTGLILKISPLSALLIIQVKDYYLKILEGKTYLFISDIVILNSEYKEQIGSPEPLKIPDIISINKLQLNHTFSYMIRAKVIAKSPMEIKNDHSLFKMVLKDSSGTILMVCNNNTLWTHFEIGKVFTFENFKVEQVSLQQNSYLTVTRYELQFASFSLFGDATKVTEYKLPSDIPELSFNFKTFSEVKNFERETHVDIIGVCHEIKPLQIVGKELDELMRDIILINENNETLIVTLSGHYAENFNKVHANKHPVLIIKYGKKSFIKDEWKIHAIYMMMVDYSKEMKTQKLREWYKNTYLNQGKKVEPLVQRALPKRRINIRKPYSKKCECKNKDEIDTFFDSLAAQVKKFPPIQRISLKEEVYKIIIKFEKKNVNIHENINQDEPTTSYNSRQ